MKKTLIPLVCVFLLAAFSAAADPSIGKIASLSGRVLIDAFGKGAFIAAIRGDLLYKASVLKTEAESRATIELQGRSQEIPPGATLRVADLLSASVRKGGLAWFAALGNLVRSFTEASQKKESDLTLGSRAGNASENSGMGEMDWEVEETDASKILPVALKEIRLGNYSAALGVLAKADPPTEPSLAWDLSFWKGFCCYQIEDYPDAVAYLSAAQAAAGAAKAPLGSAQNRRMLLFQIGSSHFLLGQDRAAIAPLEAYLAERSGEGYEPYAALMLARALAAAGDAGKARTVAEEAGRVYRGSGLESEFAALLK